MLLKNKWIFFSPSYGFCNFYDSAGSVLDSQHYIHPWIFYFFQNLNNHRIFGPKISESIVTKNFYIVLVCIFLNIFFLTRNSTTHKKHQCSQYLTSKDLTFSLCVYCIFCSFPPRGQPKILLFVVRRPNEEFGHWRNPIRIRSVPPSLFCTQKENPW